jgi:serine/threonine-protein kinase HipA
MEDDRAALKFTRTARWEGLSLDEMAHLAAKAGLPERLTLSTATETVAAFRDAWAEARLHLPMHSAVAAVIDRQLDIVPLARL